MKRQPTERVTEQAIGPAGVDLDSRFPGKYLSLTSFKRDGSAVATPVWFVVEDRRVLVNTDTQSFKAKRIRHNPAVTIAPCSASGRLRGESMPAQAELLPAGELERVKQLIATQVPIRPNPGPADLPSGAAAARRSCWKRRGRDRHHPDLGPRRCGGAAGRRRECLGPGRPD